ncbi:MAG: peptidylprolyl isomerase [Patescibacteria group bacterium]|jgi:cyclophilin family peptidyl-prolyl cis-trans isomerase
MKKFLIPIVISALALTGCRGEKNSLIDEKNAEEGINSFDSSDVNGKIKAIRNGLTPKVAPTGKSPDGQGLAGENAPADEQANTGGKIQLENLTSVYSQADIKTNFGDITVKFYSQESPVTVNVFLNLAKKNFYDGTKFHRVIKDFMIQGGDPLSKDDDPTNDGQGGPGFQFQDEINPHKLVQGSLAMANSGPNTNGSQFFIVTASSTPWLDGKHTNFGYVVDGLDTVLKIGDLETRSDRPLEDVIIEKIELK